MNLQELNTKIENFNDAVDKWMREGQRLRIDRVVIESEGGELMFVSKIRQLLTRIPIFHLTFGEGHVPKPPSELAKEQGDGSQQQ